MTQTQISDVVVPAEFTAYQVENSLVSTAIFQSGVAVRNGEMESQLQAGAQSFTVPFWQDAGEQSADITNDDPTDLSTPLKVSALKQIVRKSFLHQSWSAMSLATELSGSDALLHVQGRVRAYWDRESERRLAVKSSIEKYSEMVGHSTGPIRRCIFPSSIQDDSTAVPLQSSPPMDSANDIAEM